MTSFLADGPCVLGGFAVGTFGIAEFRFEFSSFSRCPQATFKRVLLRPTLESRALVRCCVVNSILGLLELQPCPPTTLTAELFVSKEACHSSSLFHREVECEPASVSSASRLVPCRKAPQTRPCGLLRCLENGRRWWKHRASFPKPMASNCRRPWKLTRDRHEGVAVAAAAAVPVAAMTAPATVVQMLLVLLLLGSKASHLPTRRPARRCRRFVESGTPLVNLREVRVSVATCAQTQ